MRVTTALQQIALAGLFAVSVAATAQGEAIDRSLEVVGKTNTSAAQSQQKIDDLSRETRILLEEYRSLKESAEYQADYSRELQQLDDAQQAQISP